MIKIKILLTTLNAKFIHSSLALRCLKAYAADESVYIKEYTINNNIDDVIIDIYKENADVIGFSCYIWNLREILQIIDTLKKVKKDLFIIVGGPEAYDLIENPNIDLAIFSEGEIPFKKIVSHLKDGNRDFGDIKSIAYKKDTEIKEIIYNEEYYLTDLNDVPFCYDDDLSDLENKIIYYESTRGCPFSCAYCTSSQTHGVRFLDIERVYRELKFFLDKKVPQVKFIDRTFNCNHNHAFSVWKFLIENDNGVTNFHFEIAADLLNETELELVKNARAGLFQFEIGVQSTNIATLNAINRKTDLEKLFYNVERVTSYKNIHQHLDLIAGLPLENYELFKKSFNDVYSLYPEQLQLGFLKILKKTSLRQDYLDFGIVYCSEPPYEILYNDDLSFGELIGLKMVSEVLEIFYNSGKFVTTLKYVLNFFKTPFDFYEELGSFWEAQKYNMVSHNKIKLYTLLLNFLTDKNSIDSVDSSDSVRTKFVRNLLKFDILINDNIKNIPSLLSKELTQEDRNKIRNFYKENNENALFFANLSDYTFVQKMRICNIEKFDFDMIAFVNENQIIETETHILFNYHSKSAYDKVSIGKANYHKVNL